MDPKKFGQFIAENRKEKNMTQADLAQIIGVTDKAVSRWERGIGFPDINTLEPLSRALGISILELMRSRKSDVERETLSESDVAGMMSSAVEMNRENQRQDRVSVWIGGIVTAAAAILVKLSGHASIGGAVFVGAIVSLAAVSIYFFAGNEKDRKSRKIYGFFMLAGVGMCMGLFRMLGMDTYVLAWIIYGILFVVICLLSK